MNDRQPVCEWFFIDKTLIKLDFFPHCVLLVHLPIYNTFTSLWYIYQSMVHLPVYGIFTEISTLINIEKKDN